MTVEEVKELVRLQAAHHIGATNHGITLQQAFVSPQGITVIERTVHAGRVRDRDLDVWLVGQETLPDGYKIILREDGLQFGLASCGSATDKHPILVGWYGSLKSAFMSM